MNNRLNSLFEEDIEMQNAIEDLDGLTDESDDIIISTIEDRSEVKTSLFDNEEDKNKDPEFDAAVEALAKDDEDLIEKKNIDDLSDEEMDSLLDDDNIDDL